MTYGPFTSNSTYHLAQTQDTAAYDQSEVIATLFNKWFIIVSGSFKTIGKKLRSLRVRGTEKLFDYR